MIAMSPAVLVSVACADHAASAQATPSQCGGSAIRTVSPVARSSSSVSRFAVFATQFAVVA